ncbi:unnamed protein product, partial [Phaeothamnion confervicola]
MQVGDVLLLPPGCLSGTDPPWRQMGMELWKAVVDAANRTTAAAAAAPGADPDSMHSAAAYGVASPGWVIVRQNGITQAFDITRVMFSQGNISEKLRMAVLPCEGEIVVDLFAGIGYYTLPFLVHAGACHVHACEWNPDSVYCLRHNLKANGVDARCTVYAEDNALAAPRVGRVADRVCLGLLPQSEDAWGLAAAVLRPEGGWCHVHGNV